ncbi:MAG TPA: RagB/SusD family nutrient uptake outer membrane protein [Pedobacter sp.]|nr:RagB/SusD family nutrient uptake outer membrane protein [Pedobacter sp.]
MKIKLYQFIIPISLVLGLAACQKEFLAPPPNNVTTTDSTVFSNELQARQYLSNIYNSLPSNQLNTNNGQLADGCFESEQGIQWSPLQVYNVNAYNGGAGNVDNAYGTYYPMIRKCNIFAKNEKYMTFTPANATYFKAENRFLRAFAYFELLKRYGGVPLIDSVWIYDAEDIKPEFRMELKRASFDATVKFILKDLDYAAANLPWIWPNANTDFGRASKSICMAMKSRLLLYAASPLFNANQAHVSDPNCPDSLFKYPTYDAQRWKLAMDAAKAFIDANNTEALKYALYANYGDMFITVRGNVNNKEVIFSNARQVAGPSQSNPTLNLVDMYDMTNGKPITDPTSGYNEQEPYKNRDPRLLQTILTNGVSWAGRTFEPFINGGQDYNGDRTITGMLQKKYVGITAQNQGASRFIFYRLAEIYLNYAEAQNEFESGPNTNSYTYVNLVRTRAGMPAFPTGLSKADFAAKLKKERIIEFAFEETNLFDERRWLMAETLDAGNFYGFKINKNTNGTFSYTRFVFEKRGFLKRFYLYPIPEQEIFKSPKLKQNPGWF